MTFPIEPSAKTEPLPSLPSVSRPLSPEILPKKSHSSTERMKMGGWMDG